MNMDFEIGASFEKSSVGCFRNNPKILVSQRNFEACESSTFLAR